jgi:hypothetical protein
MKKAIIPIRTYTGIVDEAVKWLLHLPGADVEFVGEEAAGILPRDRAGRAKHAFAADDLRHADDIF